MRWNRTLQKMGGAITDDITRAQIDKVGMSDYVIAD